MSNEWIAERLGLKSPGNVSQQLYRIAKALEDDKPLQRQWRALKKYEK